MTAPHDRTELELELEEAHALLRTTAGSEADTDAAAGRLAAVVHRIEAAPIDTLGDLRLRAKALLMLHEDDFQDHAVARLLETLEGLPQRLWGERIGP